MKKARMPTRSVQILFGCLVVLRFGLVGCAQSSTTVSKHEPNTQKAIVKPNSVPVIHVIVALCDNKYQGIIPVPARIGNGDDLVDNLYWGADFGVKSYFRSQKDWSLVSSVKNPSSVILERVVFRLKGSEAVMVADAYRGREIRAATQEFLNYSAGASSSAIKVLGKDFSIGGGADMLIYVGHNGLMDFKLPSKMPHQDGRTRKIAILCCKSKSFFASAVRTAGAEPILWTKDLMAPEAYVVKAAVESFLKKERGTQISERASIAYAKYQKCSVKGARTIFTSGF